MHSYRSSSGYPDSHLSPNPALASRPILRRALMLAPFVVLAMWFGYLWFIGGVVTVKEKYPNGQIMTEGYIHRVGLSGYQRHGRWVTYHINGQKESEGDYVDGIKIGEWKYWDSDGKTRSEPDP